MIPAGSNVEITWTGPSNKALNVVIVDVAGWFVWGTWGSFSSPAVRPLPWNLPCGRTYLIYLDEPGLSYTYGPTWKVTCVDACAIVGFSGKSANTVSCVNDPSLLRRTITCKPYYYAVKPSSTSIVINGLTPFGGCTPFDMCVVYGFSGKSANTLSCTTGIAQR